MGIELSRFKVIYGDRVLHALALDRVEYRDGEWPGQKSDKETITVTKPVFLGVLCINEDGNIVTLFDEAWRFQFVPILQKEG